MNFFKYLLKIGFHLGTLISIFNPALTYSNIYLLGSRNKYWIFNINYSNLLLQRCLSFIKKIGFFFGISLFYYNKFHKLPTIMKLFYLQKTINEKIILIHFQWFFGWLSNIHFSLFKLLEILSINKKKFNIYKKSIFFIKYLFLKLIYLSKRLLINFKNINNLNIIKFNTYNWFLFFKQIKFYWRTFIYFKWIHFLNIFPDSSCLFNMSNKQAEFIELASFKIPIISILDTNMNINQVTYFITGNNNSLIINHLLFQLLTLTLRKEYLYFYKNINFKKWI